MKQPGTLAEWISYLLDAVATQAKAIEALCQVNDNQEANLRELERRVAQLEANAKGGKKRADKNNR